MKKLFVCLLIAVFAVSAIPLVGAAVGETKTIVYWSMWNEQEPSAIAIKKWIEEYKKMVGLFQKPGMNFLRYVKL